MGYKPEEDFMTRTTRNGNFDLSFETASMKLNGGITISFKGLKISTNSNHDAATGVNVHKGETSMEADTLNIGLNAYADNKGVIKLAATIKDMITGKGSVGSDGNPFFEDADINCSVSGSGISYSKMSHSVGSVSKESDGSIREEGIDNYNSAFSAESFEISGSLKEVGEAICSIMAEAENAE